MAGAEKMLCIDNNVGSREAKTEEIIPLCCNSFGRGCGQRQRAKGDSEVMGGGLSFFGHCTQKEEDGVWTAAADSQEWRNEWPCSLDTGSRGERMPIPNGRSVPGGMHLEI